MKILVTGGAGFIGSHLSERLIKEGMSVFCLDNFDSYYSSAIKRRNIAPLLGKNHFALAKGDIRDSGTLEKLFRRTSMDVVIHLAARVGVRSSIQDALSYNDVNVTGTLNLLRLSSKHSVKQFVFASSSSVHGTAKKVRLSEEDQLTPISPYGVSKQAGEAYCHVYSRLHRMPTTCLRLFTVYGPRQRPDMAIHKFTKLIDESKEIPIYGDGNSKRDYTYVSDIIDGIMKALRRKFDFEIINLGSSTAIPLKYVISLIEQNLGRRARIKALPDQPGDVPITCADLRLSLIHI